MSFGRNPYVAKAELAEQKAADAADDIARIRSLRDAAHQWDRAAEREKPGKYRVAYEANAVRNREAADATADAPPPAAERLANVREKMARTVASDGAPAVEDEAAEPAAGGLLH